MLRIKQEDTVQVIAGKDKGKKGKVIKVFPREDQVMVENVNLVKKSVKKSDQYPQGGFVEIEKPLHMSNVMLIDPKDSKPTRYGVKIMKDGKKVRISKRSGEVI